MKWLGELWGTADTATRYALIAAVVVVVVALLLTVGNLDALGAWLGGN